MAAAPTNPHEQKEEDFLSEMCYEVVERIYGYLDIKSLLAMSRTSHINIFWIIRQIIGYCLRH